MPNGMREHNDLKRRKVVDQWKPTDYPPRVNHGLNLNLLLNALLLCRVAVGF